MLWRILGHVRSMVIIQPASEQYQWRCGRNPLVGSMADPSNNPQLARAPNCTAHHCHIMEQARTRVFTREDLQTCAASFCVCPRELSNYSDAFAGLVHTCARDCCRSFCRCDVPLWQRARAVSCPAQGGSAAASPRVRLGALSGAARKGHRFAQQSTCGCPCRLGETSR